MSANDTQKRPDGNRTATEVECENLDDNDGHPVDEDGDDEHQWGTVERAFMTGNPHRKCQVSGCKVFTLDLSDNDFDDESDD